MPFFYDCSQNAQTANATPNTETPHLQGTAGATVGYTIVNVMINPKNFTTVGAGNMRITTGGADTAGGAFTPNKRNPNNPAASSTWVTNPTTGGSPVIRGQASFAQSGGGVPWQALSPDAGIGVLATAKGDVRSVASTASAQFDFTFEFCESGI